MLTADAFGVLPPIARLTPEGAMYHFLSGYTAKVAGTEKGVTEPKATFSTCFGAPFLPLAPGRYAAMLGERIARHRARVWLVNTGWTGGPYGVGSRMKIALHARDDSRGAGRRARRGAVRRRDPIFNLDVPASCPDVPAERAEAARRPGAIRRAYDAQAPGSRRCSPTTSGRSTAKCPPEVRAAGPRAVRTAVTAYEPVIGLEIHAQLQTASKIFCGCSTAFGAPPNTHVCPVCLGFPGALPVLNRAAVDLGVRAALALGCRINEPSIFARKNYFYPDLPKGYQISQYEQPLASDGHRRVRAGGRRAAQSASRACTSKRTPASRCTRAFADSDRKTYVDYNRSGVPLIEIVTEPDLRSAADAAEFFSAAARDPGLARRQRRQHGRGQPALRRQRVGAAGGHRGARDEGRGQEPELVPLPAEGARVRDRAADRRRCERAAASCRRRGSGTRRPA